MTRGLGESLSLAVEPDARHESRRKYRLREPEFARQKPPPCHGCQHEDRCAREQLACQAFGDYLHPSTRRMRGTPGSLEPTRERHKRLFSGIDEDGSEALEGDAICLNCGRPFRPNSGAQKFCRAYCRHAHHVEVGTT